MRIEPYAVVQPGSRLEAGAQLKAVRKSRSKLVPEKKDPLAMMKALGQQAAAGQGQEGGRCHARPLQVSCRALAMQAHVRA